MKILSLAKCCAIFALLATGCRFAGYAQEPHSGPWVYQDGLTKENLRGIVNVGGGIVWASGAHGIVRRTEDAGYMWQSCSMPAGAEDLDFRGIQAWDENNAVVMSSGPGDQSRIYRTTDGCQTWKVVFTNPDKDGFWDAMAFWDKQHGEIIGDPVTRPQLEGGVVTASYPDSPGNYPQDKRAPLLEKKTETRFAVFVTSDGGATWKEDQGAFFQSDPHRSGAFAASNSSLVRREQSGWFGIGGLDGSFIYRGVDATDVMSFDGLFWEKKPVPISGGTESAGVFSVSFADGQHGIAVGGDYKKPSATAGTAAWTADGGMTWTAAVRPPHGYRSSVAWDAAAKAWIAVGTNGSDISYDDGRTWVRLDDGNWNALSLPWVVGPDGRVARLGNLPRRK